MTRRAKRTLRARGRTQRRNLRRGATLVSAVVLLLVVATLSSTVLSMRVTDLALDESALRHIRADAAARGALQLAAWRVDHDTDLRDALAAVLDNEGDVWLNGRDAPLQITGTLGDAAFTVDVWPRPGELRLRARAVSGGVYCDRWSRLVLEREAPDSEAAAEDASDGWQDSYWDWRGGYRSYRRSGGGWWPSRYWRR